MIHTYHIRIDGQTQTPGFLSFLYMLAEQLHLNGFANRHGNRLEIVLQGGTTEKDRFLSALTEGTAPAGGNIRVAVTEDDEETLYTGFILLAGISPAGRGRSSFHTETGYTHRLPGKGDAETEKAAPDEKTQQKNPVREKIIDRFSDTLSPFFIVQLPVDFATGRLLSFGTDLYGSLGWGHHREITESLCGNLSEMTNRHLYIALSEKFLRSAPKALVCDSDTRSFSGRWASRWSSALRVPLIKVTYTQAETALTMAENNLREPVLAICLDGAGDHGRNPGTNGGIAYCSYTHFQWLEELPPIVLPGGYRALKQPWRLAVSCLHERENRENVLPGEFTERIGKEKIHLLRQIIDRRLNSFPVTGITPLFGAVCSLLDICDHTVSDQEAPVKLGLWSSDETEETYVLSDPVPADWNELLEAVLIDLKCGLDKRRIAARFQNTLALVLTHAACRQMRKTGWRKVILCGNVFRNAGFEKRLSLRLRQKGLDVYTQKFTTAREGGIAIGQIAVAAHSLRNL